MDCKIFATIVAFLLAALATADGALKCYTCNSVTSEECKDPVAHKMEPMECNAQNIRQRIEEMKANPMLSKIAHIFDIDTPIHQQQPLPHMACAKMDLKVMNQDVTVRSCQVAKSESMDPCKVIQGKSDQMLTTMGYCGLCLNDACNGSKILSPILFLSILPLIGTFILRAINHTA